MKKILNITNSIILAIFILVLTILLVVNMKFVYNFFIDDFNNTYDLSEDEIKENYNILIDYNLKKENKDLKFIKLPMSKEGKIHFYEVKIIFQTIIKTFFISLITTTILSLILIKKYKEISFLRNASIISISIPLLLSVPMIFFFDQAFVIFHKIFFNNDYWIFDYNKDPIILYLPQNFFMVMAFLIVILIILLSLVLYIIYRKTKRIGKN